LHSKKAQEIVHRKYYKYLKTYLSDPDNQTELLAPALVGVQDNGLVSLVGQINQLYQQRQTLQFSTRRGNPKLDLIDEQIASLHRAIIENVSNLMKKSDMVLADLDERIAEVNSEIKKLPVNERQLINIQRKFNLNDNIYTYLLEKRAEAGIKKASNVSDAKILDKARPSSVYMVGPKYKMNYIMGIIIGIMVPLIIILLRDFFNTRIMDKKDIEDNTSVPMLGVVGHNASDSEFVVKDKPKSAMAESFRSVKTNLQYILLDNKTKIINITSAVSGEGKTFSSINQSYTWNFKWKIISVSRHI
jgi:tyrosine-protein kinase Etk/Wzc